MPARSFSDSTLPGRGPGRPSTAAASEPSPAAKAKIAAHRWEQKTRAQGRREGPSGSDSSALINSARGASKQERKFKAVGPEGENETKKFWKPPTA